MKKLILEDPTNTTYKILKDHHIKRLKTSTEIVSVPLTKTYNFMYDKRVIKNNFITFPYGYNDS